MMGRLEVSLTLTGTPRWDDFVDELRSTLARLGLEAHVDDDGHVTADGLAADVSVRRTPDGVEIEIRGLDVVDPDNENGWCTDSFVGPLVAAVQTDAVEPWIIDRWARRPSGVAARAGYRDPTHHRPSFGAVLDALQLHSGDVLLEIGCGGGVFLEQALQRGCRAVGIDHSAEMIDLAREVNADAVAAGRLELRLADGAEPVPFADDTFTAVAMMQVFFFLDAPHVLRESARVLRSGGRVAVFTISEAARGTPAAPEPFASHSRFYTDEELVGLAREAGFGIASVIHPDLARHARAAGLPDDLVELFSEGREAGQLLLARR
jgi:SAM-dependent methyltransferase